MESQLLVAEHVQDSRQSVALFALQKQLESLRLKEYLLLGVFSMSGAALRVPMQFLPSAEPITFFAMLSGWLFGSKKGAVVGGSALLLSNFAVMGGQGPWTPFQLAGFAAAGFIGGMLRKKASRLEVVGYAVLATLVFEIIINTSTIFFVGFSVPIALLGSLPFVFVHLASNTAFALMLPKIKRTVEKRGGFDERKLVEQMVARIKGKSS